VLLPDGFGYLLSFRLHACKFDSASLQLRSRNAAAAWSKRAGTGDRRRGLRVERHPAQCEALPHCVRVLPDQGASPHPFVTGLQFRGGLPVGVRQLRRRWSLLGNWRLDWLWRGGGAGRGRLHRGSANRNGRGRRGLGGGVRSGRSLSTGRM